MPEPTDTAGIAVALAELRGTMAEGFARVDGSLALLVQRHDQTDRRLDEHGRRIDSHDTRLDTLEAAGTEWQQRVDGRLDELESGRWPVKQVSALVGVVGLLVTLAVTLWNLANQ